MAKEFKPNTINWLAISRVWEI